MMQSNEIIPLPTDPFLRTLLRYLLDEERTTKAEDPATFFHEAFWFTQKAVLATPEQIRYYLLFLERIYPDQLPGKDLPKATRNYKATVFHALHLLDPYAPPLVHIGYDAPPSVMRVPEGWYQLNEARYNRAINPW